MSYTVILGFSNLSGGTKRGRLCIRERELREGGVAGGSKKGRMSEIKN
jgi:hypothetical protein